MNARAAIGTPLVGMGRSTPATALALIGACVLLVEAALADLLFGFGDPTSSPLRTVLLLVIGGLMACGAALLVRSAPRAASLLALLAVSLAAWAQLPFFVERLHDRVLLTRLVNNKLFVFPPAPETTPSLGQTYAPLIAWLLAVVPLVCAVVLAWRGTAHSGERRAP